MLWICTKTSKRKWSVYASLRFNVHDCIFLQGVFMYFVRVLQQTAVPSFPKHY